MLVQTSLTQTQHQHNSCYRSNGMFLMMCPIYALCSMYLLHVCVARYVLCVCYHECCLICSMYLLSYVLLDIFYVLVIINVARYVLLYMPYGLCTCCKCYLICLFVIISVARYVLLHMLCVPCTCCICCSICSICLLSQVLLNMLS